MKVIITGVTGRVGSAVLQQCLSHPDINSIIALSRREPATSHPSLTWIQHEDFTTFPSAILSQLHGAEACLYCLGTNASSDSASRTRTVNLEYALATARFLEKNLASLDGAKQPFRFVYLSGCFVEKDPSKTLFFLSETRKMRGELETELLALDQRTAAAGGFKVFIARSGIVQVEAWHAVLGLLGPTIPREVLSKALVRIALAGSQETIVENQALLQIGKS